jgi:hypothetical protein
MYVYITICTYVREYMYEGAEERQGFICFSLPLCVCVPCVIIYYKKLFTHPGLGWGGGRAESINWFIEWPGFLAVVWFSSSPTHSPTHLPSASCLSFSVFLCVAGRPYWLRESLALYKLLNTLWGRVYLQYMWMGYLRRTLLTIFRIPFCYVPNLRNL